LIISWILTGVKVGLFDLISPTIAAVISEINEVPLT
jgi:hypothetical protein